MTDEQAPFEGPPAAGGPSSSEDHTVSLEAPPPPPGEGEDRPREAFRAAGGSPLSAGVAAARAAAREVTSEPPWVLAAGAVLLAFALGWLTDVLLAFRHARGLTGQGRVLDFFGVGSIPWGVAVLVGVAFVAMGRLRSSGRGGHLTTLVPLGLFFAAVAVAGCAAIDFLVELANFGNGIDSAFSGLFSYLGALGLGAAGLWWARAEVASPDRS